ncbi:MAG: DMT family transporter [Armatimonadetes bacterium]|nr:DMT family transporter [Armatimonadota bacterium]
MARFREFLPILALTLVALIWGFNFSMIKFVYADFTIPTTGLLRYLLMVPLMFIVAKAMGQLVIPAKGERLRFFATGLMSSGVYMILFLEGMRTAAPAQGAIALATVPIWIGIFSILAKQETFRWNLVYGSILAYVGVGAVIMGKPNRGEGELMGVVLVLVAAIAWAASVIMMKPLLAKDKPALGTFAATFPGAAIVMIPYGIRDMLATDYSAITPQGWGALSYLVVMAGTVAFVFYYISLREVGPIKTSMVAYFVPIIAAFGEWLLLKQPLGMLQVAGVGVVLIGVLVARPPRPVSAPTESFEV